ncbi:glycolate oxidase subunit GlcD [Arthrobacter sp. Hiyo8]|nr:glycolate oxidase subunit GlcD [Arthrobacter sp. Hiyo8]
MWCAVAPGTEFRSWPAAPAPGFRRAHASQGCIVLSLERMNRILQLNADDETAVVEPGVVNADLNAAASEHGLMYAPDPASYKMSTIGGNVATNAGGLRCAKYGVTRDSVLALDVVLADGSLIHTGHQTFKGVAGYDLTALFVGSEGTLGIVVGVTVRLRYLPREVQTVAAFYPDFRGAAAGVLAVGRTRVSPPSWKCSTPERWPSSTNCTARTSENADRRCC